MTRLNVKLLGRMTCKLPDGQPLRLSTRKSEALLAFLAMSPGVYHPRERLVNLFWSDRGEDQARNSLRQALSSLKKLLDAELPDLLEVERTAVRLNSERIAVDVDDFNLLVEEPEIEKLVKAVDIYRGEFLEGMSIRDPAGEQWLAEERENLKRIYVEVLGRLSRLQLDNNNYRAAILSAERLVSIDPLEESGWRLLMTANHHNGNRNHALMAYKRCCDVLQKELGVEPEAETQDLQEKIKLGRTESKASESKPIGIDLMPSQEEQTTSSHSLLVLPFKNLSDDSGQQYFSDGLTDSIILGLALFPGFKIHSRHSSFAAVEQNLSIKSIGEQFGANYIVTGSVRKSSDQIRVSAQLVNASTGEQIWGNQFDNPIEETLALEDRLTRSIVAAIKGKIELADAEVAIRKPAQDIKSYDLLLQGYYHLQKYNPADSRKSIELLNECLELEPDNPVTHNRLYQSYIVNWLCGWSAPRQEVIHQAGQHINRALALAADDALIQADFAEYSMFIAEWDKAEVYADRSLLINPNDPEVLATVCAVYAGLGQVDKAIKLAETCYEMDPFHPWIHWVVGVAYYRGKQYQEALKAFNNMPNPADEIDGWLAACYYRLGDQSNATKHLHLYLETCKANMAEFPQSLDEWQQFWTASASFKPISGEDIDYPFDALCGAGLKDLIGSSSPAANAEQSHSIAVLPFDNLSGDSEQEYFSDGITDSIILHLASFPGLKVKSRNSSFAFKQQIKSLGEICEVLDVDYLVEGSIRKSDQRIRITVQLIEAHSGNQIWGRRYDGELENLFDYEEELSRTIAATVTGQIESELQRIALAKGASDQKAYDLLLSGTYHYRKFTGPNVAIAIEKLNQCLELDPNNILAHAWLYYCHSMNWMERWVEDYKPSLELARKHAARALELGPENGAALIAYAEQKIFRREYQEAFKYIERARAINPNDPDVHAMNSLNLTAIGRYEESLVAASIGCALDPYHHWCDWCLAEAQFFCQQHEKSLETIAISKNAPGFIRIYTVASCLELGRVEQARKALQEFLAAARNDMQAMPKTREEWLSYTIDNAPYEDTNINHQLIDCLFEAGLEKELKKGQSSAEGESENSSVIVVLPFDNLSNDPDQEYFSDGITDSIILNLSLFPDLNIKSRNASFAFKQQIKDLGEISKELNVDYLLEGSIRKSDDQVRINVQLIEATSGNQVWGKRYDIVIEKLFDLEAELSRTVAATVTGQIDADLQRIAIRKGANNQTAYDLLLSGNYHCYKLTRADMAISIEKLNRCLELDPDNHRAYSGLYDCHLMNAIERWVPDHEASFKQAGVCAQKALALAPENTHALSSLAEFLTFSRKPQEALGHIKKALKLNPNDAVALCEKSFALNMMGQHAEAIKHAEFAFQLDPYFPWAAWNLSESQILAGRYEEALQAIADAKHDPELLDIYSIVANVKLGRLEPARQTLVKYIENCKNNMVSMPKTRAEWLDYSKTYTPLLDTSLNEDIVDCLIQAGLEEELAKFLPVGDSDDMPSILVLPFENMSGDPEQEYFSDGMTENVILNLSLFNDLNVKSRHASFAFKNSSLNIEEIAKELDVQYIVDGSVRKRGEQIRITVQLIDSLSGNQIWGKRFDTPLEDLFELEEEMVQTIAGTISGKIGREIKSSSIRKPAKDLHSYDYLMRAWHHVEKYTPEENLIALNLLDRCLEIDPDYVEAHTLIAATNSVQLFENWADNRQQTKASTKKHLLKALDLDPGDAFSHVILSAYLMLERDFKSALFHSEKSIELNPALPDGHSSKAYVLSSQGKIDQAVEMANFSLQIDPYHYYMGWDAGLVFHRAGLYEKAIEAFQSIPMMPPSLLAETAACQFALGEEAKAKVTMKKYRELAQEQMPNFPTTVDAWRSLWYENEPFESDEDFDIYFNRLLDAGLCDEFIESGETLPSILVLPFENMSGDPEQEYVSNGMTESIILNLNSFQGLKVKSRHASFAFKDSPMSIDEIAQKLDVQFVVEGSVRKRGEQIRTTVQLADTASGNQIWGKRFDTPMVDLLDLEEELVQTIAGAISGRIDRELRATSALKTASSMKSYDYLMRGWYHAERFNPEDYALSIENLRKCVELDPDNAQAHAVLTGIVNVLLYENWTTDREAVRREADYHINRALELDRNNALAHAFMSEHQILQHNHKKALFHADKAIEHNPALPDGYSIKSYLLSTMGQHEEAVKLAEFSLQMDPYHFYMAWNAGIVYRNAGEFQKSIDAFRSLPYPSPGIYAELAASLVGNGEVEEAREEMDKFKKLARDQMPQYPATVEAWRTFWQDVSGYQYDEDFDSFFNLMVKAELCGDIAQDPSELPSIAVLTFENLSGDPEQEYFSDGITANVILGLGLFKGLAVKSQRSSFAFKESNLDSKAIAEKLEADYLVEGSIRKSGNRIRLSVQLIDASKGNQIWGKQFDEELSEVLELEQELSRTIAATVSGRIEHEIQQTSVRKTASNLASYDHLMRGLYHFGLFTAKDLVIGCDEIRKCLEIDPDNAIAHYNLASALGLQVLENWAEDRQKNLEEAFEHHSIALKLDPGNAQSHAYFSETLVLRGDYQQAEFHSRRSIDLNPTASEGHASLADILCNTRRAEEAFIHAEQCLKLDPYSAHAGWVAGDVFRNLGQFPRAIKTFRAISHPAPTIHAMVATCFVGMGLLEEAQAEMKLYLELARNQMAVFPESVEAWRKVWRDSSFYHYDEDFDSFFGQLLEAGLSQSTIGSDKEIPSIAVLPFENMSGDSEQEYFSDGITTDIIATLSKFSHMRTMSRYSILKYKTEKASIDEIAVEQNVRYILEGSVRRSGERIRVSAELIDSQTHDAVWSDRYDRMLDDLFAVQDEIAKSIAVALKVHLDDGDMAMHRSAGTSNIKAWELVLTAVDLQDTYIQKNILEARSMAMEATRLDPNYPYAWVCLGWTYWQEIYAGWGSDSMHELLLEAEQVCQKAFDILPDYSEAWSLRGLIHLMKHESDQALEACRRAVELEPGHAESQALMAFAYLFVDDFDQARRHNQKMLNLCPVLPNWYYLIEGETHRLEGNLSESIQVFRKGIDVEPESPLCRFYLIDALMEIGDITNARKIADEIRALDDSANGKGLIQAFSSNAATRESFRANLAHFDLV